MRLCTATIPRSRGGTRVQVNLYSDRLEFLNPGGLYGTVTAETIGRAGYSSMRNQFLSDILESTPYEGGFVAENRGTGFRLMERELVRNGMRPPVVRDSISMFSLTFEKGTAGDEANPEEVIIAYLAENGASTSAEMSEALGVSRSTLNARLRRLIEAGRVVRTGAKRSRNQKYRLP